MAAAGAGTAAAASSTSTVATIATIVSAITAAAAAYASARNTQAAAKAQGEAAEYNATIAKQNSDIARSQTAGKEDLLRRKTAAILGEQRAAIGQSGLGLSGSMLDIYDESETNAEMDALNIRYEGELAARGYGNTANLENYYGDNAKRNAKQSMTGGYLGMAGSLLSGAGKAYAIGGK